MTDDLALALLAKNKMDLEWGNNCVEAITGHYTQVFTENPKSPNLVHIKEDLHVVQMYVKHSKAMIKMLKQILDNSQKKPAV